MYSSEAALSPPNPLSPCSCVACHGKRGFKEKGIVGWLPYAGGGCIKYTISE